MTFCQFLKHLQIQGVFVDTLYIYTHTHTHTQRDTLEERSLPSHCYENVNPTYISFKVQFVSKAMKVSILEHEISAGRRVIPSECAGPECELVQ
jgi:hypothetical protein